MDYNREILEIETEELLSICVENSLSLDKNTITSPDAAEHLLHTEVNNLPASTSQIKLDSHLEGHIHNLSVEKRDLLYKFWNLLLGLSEKIEKTTNIDEMENVFRLYIKFPSILLYE